MLYIVECGRKRKALRKICEQCGEEFLHASNQKNRKYCCRQCKDLNSQKRVKCKCAFCNREVIRVISKLGNSKSGLYFCTRECKDKAQRIENSVLRISHYDNGTWNYRKTARKAYILECGCCGWDEDSRILEVHHIDSNRDNNNIENLIILCPTCHRKITLKYYKLTVLKSGKGELVGL